MTADADSFLIKWFRNIMWQVFIQMEFWKEVDPLLYFRITTLSLSKQPHIPSSHIIRWLSLQCFDSTVRLNALYETPPLEYYYILRPHFFLTLQCVFSLSYADFCSHFFVNWLCFIDSHSVTATADGPTLQEQTWYYGLCLEIMKIICL